MKDKINEQIADVIRGLAVAMVEKAQSGHPGGPMGGADFMHILYTEFFRYDPDDMTWAFRDRFFMDAGHLSTLLYAQYYLLGHFQKNDVANFRQWKSVTPGHPEVDVLRGIENTSGPLGQGHGMGAGAAIAAKFLQARFGNWIDHKIYAFISDGGVQEEISQGIGRIAGYLGLNNLIMFYDSNDVQLSTKTNEVSSEDTAMKYESWGWKVITIDGHNHAEIRQALGQAINEKECPTLIIGKTIMGKGCVDANGQPYEGHCELHGQPIGQTKASYEKTLQNLGLNPQDPFEIPIEVKDFYNQVIEKKKKEAKQKKEAIEKWSKSNEKLASKLQKFLSGQVSIELASVGQKENQSTRAASSSVLAYLAENVENMIVASADLSNSDKTDGFLKKTKAFSKSDFSGAFLQAGVAELSMAVLANGMALHGGVIPVVATFFVFSDYMKPALRLSALQELPVKYVWTHDSFRVGEDGPTHQPVEHEAQIRLMEKLKNHKGKNSMLVLRPADVNETTIAWEMAINNVTTPTALILSRQNIDNLPNSSYSTAHKATKGAYIVQTCEKETPDVVLLANGSEVSTLIQGAKLLAEKGIKSQVVSVISEGLFRNQDTKYQKEVLPDDIPRFGLTAGLPVTLQGLVGEKGMVWGVEHFGYSAPFKILDEKFGFTAENVYKQVLNVLKK